MRKENACTMKMEIKLVHSQKKMAMHTVFVLFFAQFPDFQVQKVLREETLRWEVQIQTNSFILLLLHFMKSQGSTPNS